MEASAPDAFPAWQPPNAGPIALTATQQFDIERMSRTIDATDCVETLRNTCKLLLKSWQARKAATNWAIRQQVGAPSRL
jgi:hypothetical protein